MVGREKYHDQPLYIILLNYASSGSSVRTTNTSQEAERTIYSDTLPIKNRSMAFRPVAPQMIKSASTFLAMSLEIIDFGEP